MHTHMQHYPEKNKTNKLITTGLIKFLPILLSTLKGKPDLAVDGRDPSSQEEGIEWGGGRVQGEFKAWAM